MNIIAWLILGAIAGYLAGFLASLLFNDGDAIQGALDISSIVVSVIGAIIAVVVFNLVTGRTRTGRGAI